MEFFEGLVDIWEWVMVLYGPEVDGLVVDYNPLLIGTFLPSPVASRYNGGCLLDESSKFYILFNPFIFNLLF